MATVEYRHGKWRAMIRKKNKMMSATFNDKITADTWARYHEELIENMEAFAIPPENLISIEDCIDFKLEDLKSKNYPKRTTDDFEYCKREFSSIMSCPLGSLSSDMVRDIAQEMLGNKVRRGGTKGNETSGIISLQSPATVLRKLRVLSSAISFMIEKGANIVNPVQVVVNQVKMMVVKDTEEIE